MSIKSKLTKISVLTLFLLVLALVPFAKASAAAPIYVRTGGDDSLCDGTVDVDYSGGVAPACAVATIQQGINLVDAGGTVYVAPGTYAGQITVNKSVTVYGDPGDATPGPGVNAPVVDGGSVAGDAFLLANGVNHVTIEGLEISNFAADPNPAVNGIGNGISAWEASTSYITIRDNYFHHLGWNAVLVGNDDALGDHTNWLITANVVDSVDYIGFELTNTSNSTIEGNIIHLNNTYIGAIFSSARRSESGLNILNNYIDGTPSALYPVIYLYAYDLDMASPNLDDVLIQGNTINTIGTPYQIYLRNIGTGTITNAQVLDNNINSFKNLTGETVDATCNWWGAISGPTSTANPGGTGGTISGNVLFAPWLIYDDDASTDPGLQLPASVTVTSPGDVSEAENDFRILQNAVGCAVDGQTLDLSGDFDWSATSSYANASYLASYTGTDYGDIRGVEIPEGIDNLTITSALTDAHITGAGDVDDSSTLIFSTFLFGEDAPGNANLTIEKLVIDDFEGAVTLGWNAVGTYPNTMIQDNEVLLAGDNGDASDWIQNIAFYFWVGANQTIQNNTVTFMANGSRTVGYYGPKNGSSFGYQSATSGGSAYDGLLITNNIFQVGATSNGVEETFGIWENGHNDVYGTDIWLISNQFLGRAGDDFDHAFLLSSQSGGVLISGNILDKVDEVFTATKSQGHSSGDEYAFTGNTLTSVGGADGIFLNNVTNDDTPITVDLFWDLSNTVDGETGIRGLNELSVDATHATRASSAAEDLAAVFATPSAILADNVDDGWLGASRFTDPDGIGAGNELAFEYNAFDTIQGGVDAVSAGGTVNVAAGTYTEQVTITKDLSLLGDNRDSIIQAYASMPVCFTTSYDAHPVVCVKDSVATINGFTIDGHGFGNTNYRFNGVAFRNAGGTLENNNIIDVRDTPFSGAQHGVAVYAYNTGTTEYTLHVLNNTITGFQKNAMALNADDPTPFVVDVQDNAITGAGTTDVTAQNGIQVWAASGSGTVDGNTIDGIAYSGSGWIATSVLNYYATLDVINNTITGTHMGVYYVDGDGLVDGNNVTVIKSNEYAYGIVPSDPPTAKAQPYGEETTGAAAPSLEAFPAPAAPVAVVVSNNDVVFSGVDNTGSYGIEVDSGYGPLDIAVDVHDNFVNGFDYGLTFWGCTSGCSTGTMTSIAANFNDLLDNNMGLYLGGSLTATPTIHHNRIFSDGGYGLYNDLAYGLTAENNWWGCNEGPTTDGSTDCDLYYGNVDVDPWLILESQVNHGDLVFSEYLEGTSNNKALEIYNGTGAKVDLSAYSVKLYPNGGTSPTSTLTWPVGTYLANGDVYVIANPSATSAIMAVADITSTVTYYNGDDAVAIFRVSDNSVVDVIGQIGFDPGTVWGTEPITTAEHTLVRMPDACSGDTNASDAFNPAAQYLSYPQNTFTYLGSHTADCGSIAPLQTAKATSRLITNSDMIDTRSLGTVLDGVLMSYSAVNGTMDPTVDGTKSGFTSSIYTANHVGVNDICVVLDNEQLCNTVSVISTPDITALELLGSIDGTTWSATSGNIDSGYLYEIDPMLEFQYLDAGTYTVTQTLANGFYGFYLDETTVPADFFTYWAAKGVVSGAGDWMGFMWEIINGNQPMFFLKVDGSEYSLLDGLQYLASSGTVESPLRVSGDYPLGEYAFNGEITDIYGGTGSEIVSITFAAGDYTPSIATTVTVDCGTSWVGVLGTVTCEVTVTAAEGTDSPTGLVSWLSDSSGDFSSASCTLSGSGGSATCSVSYTPTARDSGSHTITATYEGNLSFSGNSNTASLEVRHAFRMPIILRP